MSRLLDAEVLYVALRVAGVHIEQNVGAHDDKDHTFETQISYFCRALSATQS